MNTKKNKKKQKKFGFIDEDGTTSTYQSLSVSLHFFIITESR